MQSEMSNIRIDIMSILRPASKIVSNTIFTKPNNYILSSSFRTVYLTKSKVPTINYLHSVRAYLQTINLLTNYQASFSMSYLLRGYIGIALMRSIELFKLQSAPYKQMIMRYMNQNCDLTAQAIGNLYYAAEFLQVDSLWFQAYVLPSIPQEIPNMSLRNLKDTLNGVNKYHPNHPIQAQLTAAIEKKEFKEFVVVRPFMANNSKFQYLTAQDDEMSPNLVLHTLMHKKGLISFLGMYMSRYITHRGKYVLHTED